MLAVVGDGADRADVTGEDDAVHGRIPLDTKGFRTGEAAPQTAIRRDQERGVHVGSRGRLVSTGLDPEIVTGARHRAGGSQVRQRISPGGTIAGAVHIDVPAGIALVGAHVDGRRGPGRSTHIHRGCARRGAGIHRRRARLRNEAIVTGRPPVVGAIRIRRRRELRIRAQIARARVPPLDGGVGDVEGTGSEQRRIRAGVSPDHAILQGLCPPSIAGQVTVHRCIAKEGAIHPGTGILRVECTAVRGGRIDGKDAIPDRVVRRAQVGHECAAQIRAGVVVEDRTLDEQAGVGCARDEDASAELAGIIRRDPAVAHGHGVALGDHTAAVVERRGAIGPAVADHHPIQGRIRSAQDDPETVVRRRTERADVTAEDRRVGTPIPLIALGFPSCEAAVDADARGQDERDGAVCARRGPVCAALDPERIARTVGQGLLKCACVGPRGAIPSPKSRRRHENDAIRHGIDRDGEGLPGADIVAAIGRPARVLGLDRQRRGAVAVDGRGIGQLPGRGDGRLDLEQFRPVRRDDVTGQGLGLEPGASGIEPPRHVRHGLRSAILVAGMGRLVEGEGRGIIDVRDRHGHETVENSVRGGASDIKRGGPRPICCRSEVDIATITCR